MLIKEYLLNELLKKIIKNTVIALQGPIAVQDVGPTRLLIERIQGHVVVIAATGSYVPISDSSELIGSKFFILAIRRHEQ